MDKDFFDERLLYHGLNEFYNKRLIIKTLLRCKNNNEKYMYRLYVYSRAFINDTWKDIIWEYLQNDIDDNFFDMYYQEYIEKKKHLL